MHQILLRIVLASLWSVTLFAQSDTKSFSWDAQYLNGVILEHNPDIARLIQGRSQGFLVKYNKHTSGQHIWEQQYNYPDWGFSFLYQDMGNEVLGQNFSALGHYNFYFLKRQLSLSIGTGIAYNSNPYDAEDNPLNVAYGSHLMSASLLGLSYKKDRLIGDIGLEAGFLLAHYSNGRLRTPNTSTNVFSFTVGLNYTPFEQQPYLVETDLPRFSEAITLNAAVLGGANENNVVGLGRQAFMGIQAFVDKRISYKSSFQLGGELFISGAMQDYIRYRAAAFPEDGLQGDEDSKRVGIFAGYELRVSQVAAFVQLGYYIYYPVDFEGRVYNRLGVKRYFGDHIFGLVAVKAHAAKAEALEFGLGYRF